MPGKGWRAEMTMTYQEQQLLQAVTGRAAILDLTARHNRAYSDGDRDRWLATFRHSGATYTRDGEVFRDLRSAFDGGDGQRDDDAGAIHGSRLAEGTAREKPVRWITGSAPLRARSTLDASR